MPQQKNTRVLILSGGKGTRMGAPVPKTLVPVAGTPIIDRILSTVAQSGIDARPAVVIGHDLHALRVHIGQRAEFVIQEEQRGTGHAVMVAREALRAADNVMVFYGDHPLYSANTLRSLVETHALHRAAITMTTVVVPDYQDWRAVYTHYGRIIRRDDGCVTAIREYAMCTDTEKSVREVNNGLYCFNATWLWRHIHMLSDQNPKHEFLLTDLIAMAVEQEQSVQTAPCPADEGIGVNTPEEVRMAEHVIALAQTRESRPTTFEMALT